LMQSNPDYLSGTSCPNIVHLHRLWDEFLFKTWNTPKLAFGPPAVSRRTRGLFQLFLSGSGRTESGGSM
jgi:hypothetical protein